MATGTGFGRGNRGVGYDKEVQRVAPLIRQLQGIGDMTIADITAALNEATVAPPTGIHWSYGTTRRAMIRAAELETGVSTRSLNSPRTFYRPTTPKWMGVIFTTSTDCN